MANKRVIELNERTQIDMNDWLLVDSSTSTRKLSIATLLSYFTYYSLIFVEELPTQDIQPNVVYLVPHSGSNTQWDEYIYINNDWSLIGTATIDLESIYQTKTDNNLQTTSKQIVGAINEINSDLAKHTFDSPVNIKTYTSSNQFEAPTDGYVQLVCSSDTAILNVNGLGLLSHGPFTSDQQTSLFVKKGMQLYVTYTGNPLARFYPLS